MYMHAFKTFPKLATWGKTTWGGGKRLGVGGGKWYGMGGETTKGENRGKTTWGETTWGENVLGAKRFVTARTTGAEIHKYYEGFRDISAPNKLGP